VDLGRGAHAPDAVRRGGGRPDAALSRPARRPARPGDRRRDRSGEPLPDLQPAARRRSRPGARGLASRPTRGAGGLDRRRGSRWRHGRRRRPGADGRVAPLPPSGRAAVVADRLRRRPRAPSPGVRLWHGDLRGRNRRRRGAGASRSGQRARRPRSCGRRPPRPPGAGARAGAARRRLPGRGGRDAARRAAEPALGQRAGVGPAPRRRLARRLARLRALLERLPTSSSISRSPSSSGRWRRACRSSAGATRSTWR